MKIAIIHDWLTGMRGGEKVLESLFELYPDADLYTLFHIKGSVSPIIENRNVFTSFLQRAPAIDSKYRYLLPLFPAAIQSLRLKTYDLVISSSHCVAKGIRFARPTPHLCYCYTPMRYLWAMLDDYFKRQRSLPTGSLSRYLFPLFSGYLKKFDLKSNQTVDRFIGISNHIAERIKKYYGSPADVIYPPVETDRFSISPTLKDYYLIISAFAPYKRIDLAIAAFNQLGAPLLIVGGGPEEKRLRKMANANINFLGALPNEALPQLLAECKAFIFPGEEDFGIAPVEAMASGRPVIAYAKGGALETITADTGIFFNQQSPSALSAAIHTFEQQIHRFDPQKIRARALTFDKTVFQSRFKAYVKSYLDTPTGLN